jgi:allantoin racemase
MKQKSTLFSDLEFDVEDFKSGEGPFTIESEYDRALAEPGTISLVEKTENDVISIRSVEIPVPELSTSQEKLIEKLFGQMIKAIKNDGAEVMVLGCTEMMGVADIVQGMLNEKGYDVPVVNPAEVFLRFMECLLIMVC